MSQINFFYRAFRLLVLIEFSIIFFENTVECQGHSKVDTIAIGVIFDQNTDEIQKTFRFAMKLKNADINRRLDFQAFVDIINTADAFKLSRLICNHFARGVWSILGAVTPDSFDTLHSFTNTFQMPFITPWFPEKVKQPSSGLLDHAVSLRPDYHRAVIDTITFYGWKNVIYLYDSHDGLLRLQQLYNSMQPGNFTFSISHVKRVGNASDAVQFLSALEKLDRWSIKYVVLDSNTRLAKDVLISHVREVQLGRRNYHYLLSGLVMDDRWEKEIIEYGAVNVTGFKILDPSRKAFSDFLTLWKNDHHTDTISAQAALMYDGVQVLVDTFYRLLKKKPDIYRIANRRAAKENQGNATKIIDCNPTTQVNPFEHGEKITRLVKKTELEGLTGRIRFNEQGHRQNFTLQVVELNEDVSFRLIAKWYDRKGFIPVTPKIHKLSVPGAYNRNHTYIVTSILESPYLIDDSASGGAAAYDGFCKDFADMLAYMLEIKYEMRLVKDGKYGSEDPKKLGGWDGIVGELVRKETDMAIAPLSVTLDRERVIDFSKPFLSLDRHINTEKKPAASIFSFLQPLSSELWLCILVSLFAVSVVLFIVSRFSPNEVRLVSFSEIQHTELDEVPTTKTSVVNDFSFWNSMWFSLSAIMQQGSELAPRSVSGRIVGTVWWFFTLIVVSFYTANLASSLTINKISKPLSYYDSITTICSSDATADINSALAATPRDHIEEHQSWIFSLLSSSTRLITDQKEDSCMMRVSQSRPGLKEFAVAFPKTSKLREGVNLAIQSLKDTGELQKLIQKWFTRPDCQDVFDQVCNQQDIQGSELTLGDVAGLFYVLLGGLAIALAVAAFEFCRRNKTEMDKNGAPLQSSACGRTRGLSTRNQRNTEQNTPTCDRDRLGWNGTSFPEFYAPANQIAHEDNALHGSFTQV